jgi:hypothetical protein
MEATAPNAPVDTGQGNEGKADIVTLTKSEHEALIKERDNYKTSHEKAEELIGRQSGELGELRKFKEEKLKTPPPPLLTAKDFYDIDPITGEKILNEEKLTKGVDTIVNLKLAPLEDRFNQVQYQTNVIQAQGLLVKAKITDEKEQVSVLQYMAENGMKPSVVNCQLALQAVKGQTPEKIREEVEKKVYADLEAKGIQLPDSRKSTPADKEAEGTELVKKYKEGILKAGKSNW